MAMSELPEVVAEYVRYTKTPDRALADEIALCFAEDGEVVDEGTTRRGRDAIRQWWEGPATAFEYSVEVLDSRTLEDGRYVLFTRLEGNFPGSVAELAYRFTVRDGLISQLEIGPPGPGEI